MSMFKRDSVRMVKPAVFSLLVGSVIVAQVWGLCTDMHGTCDERGRDVHNRLYSHPDQQYRHCEVVLTILECIEEYICTCNLTVTANLDQTFMDTATEYLATCHNASAHTARNSTRLSCMVGKPLPVDVPDNPEVELEVKDTISRAEIEELDSRLLRDCPPYVHCSETYHSALEGAVYIANTHQRLAAVCVANRLNLVCMSDAFCACQEGDNQLLHKAMDAIRQGHESSCQEQISEPIMKCSSSASQLIPGLLVVLIAGLLQLTLTAL